MCIRIFRAVRDGLFSLFVSSSLQDAEALTKEEKKLLVKTWPNLKEKTPNMFLRAWIKSAQMSVNIRKATGLREDEEPEINEKFLSLSPLIENFVDKLIVEFRCNDDKLSQFRKFFVAEACRKLGARHLLIENFHMNFWDIFLGNLIQIIIDTHSERNQQEIAVVCEKFCSFFVSFMRDGYKKRLQEEISGRRRMKVG